MGPAGRHVVIEKSYGGPAVTKDGVSVAKEVELPEPFENMGAKMVNQVAKKTADKAGDGTTTATVLAQAIFTEGLQARDRRREPVHLQRGINNAPPRRREAIDASSGQGARARTTTRRSRPSAPTTTTEGRRAHRRGDRQGRPDGVVEIEDGKSAETTLDYVEGMQFDKGYLSPYFMTDPKTGECVLEDAYILIHEKKISNLPDLLPLLNKIADDRGKPLLIIAEDVENEALAALVVNRCAAC
jgi:chaperonin GroEL